MPDPIRDDWWPPADIEQRLLLIHLAYVASLTRTWQRSLAILRRQEAPTRAEGAMTRQAGREYFEQVEGPPMPAAIIASLPPLTFAPAAQAPVSPQRCVVAPADAEWCIAHREERGWFNEATGMQMDEPLIYAALPPAPGRTSPRMIKGLVGWLVDSIEDGEYDSAARAIDQLADAVRAVRDTKPGS